jgi:gliding motility-associated-like protein
VRIYPSPTADFTADPMIADQISPIVHFTNLSSGYSNYEWHFGDGAISSVLNPVHEFSDTGLFSALLITTNQFGCRDSILKLIEVRPKSTLFIPNCFTPNGDGKNDVFKPEFTQQIAVRVYIYDRWGRLLADWDNLDGSWDGYYRGSKCQTDTYVYKIIATGIDGVHNEWVGHVSIVY